MLQMAVLQQVVQQKKNSNNMYIKRKIKQI